MRTVLDAAALIAHLDESDAHHRRATAEIEVAGERGALLASVLSVAEILVHPTRQGRAAEVERALSEMDLEVLAVPDDAAAALARLRDRTRRNMPDCCVLLAAQQTSAIVLTFDEKLASAARDLGLATHDSSA